MRTIAYPKPGEILLHEFLEPMGITQYRLAKAIGVPQRRMDDHPRGRPRAGRPRAPRPGRQGARGSAAHVGGAAAHRRGRAHR